MGPVQTSTGAARDQYRPFSLTALHKILDKIFLGAVAEALEDKAGTSVSPVPPGTPLAAHGVQMGNLHSSKAFQTVFPRTNRPAPAG